MTRESATRRRFLRTTSGALVGSALLNGSSLSARAQPSESWTQFGYDDANTGYAPDNTGPVADISRRWAFETGDRVSTPAVVNGTAYVGSASGDLHAVDMSSGDQEWVFEGGDTELRMPTVTNGTVYVNGRGLNDNYTYAIDASTGERRWAFAIHGSRGSPAVVDDTVYIGGVNAIYAVDAASGEQSWEYRTGRGANSSPAVVDETVYVANTDDELLALDAPSGDERWSFDAAISGGSPAVADGTVYFRGIGVVYAVDATSGDRQWTVDTGDKLIGSPAVANGTVYVGSAASRMYALGSTSGSQQWIFEGGALGYGAPAVAGDTVYVGSQFNSESYKLYAVDGDSGSERWAFETESWVISPPAVADGTVYAAGQGDTVSAISGRTPTPTNAPTATPADAATPTDTLASTGTERGNETDLLPVALGVLGVGGVGAWWLNRGRHEADIGRPELITEENIAAAGDTAGNLLAVGRTGVGLLTRGGDDEDDSKNALRDAESTVATGDTTRKSEDFRRAIDSYEMALDTYVEAKKEAETAAETESVENAIAETQAKLDAVRDRKERIDAIRDPLRNAESSFQTAVSQHAQNNRIPARRDYRQARDQYDQALDALAELDEDVFEQAGEITVPVGLEADSLPTRLTAWDSLSESERETLSDAGIGTLSDVRNAGDSVRRELVADGTIDEQLADRLRAVTWWHGGDERTFTSRKAIERQRDRAEEGYQTL